MDNIVSPVMLANGRIGFSVRERVNPSLTGVTFDMWGNYSGERAVRLLEAAEKRSMTVDAFQIRQIISTLKAIDLKALSK